MKIEVIFNKGAARIIECERFYEESDNTLRFKDADDQIIAKIQKSQLAGWIDVTSKDDGEPCGKVDGGYVTVVGGCLNCSHFICDDVKNNRGYCNLTRIPRSPYDFVENCNNFKQR